jgi:imidazoleglycerol phosphate dehydratase HisB
MVGKMPTEMFCISLNPSQMVPKNINIKAEGQNEHHKIEAILRRQSDQGSCKARYRKNDFT